MVKASFKPSLAKVKKGVRQAEQTAQLLNTIEAVKMLSLYVLRNQGWGAKRLAEFNHKLNEYITDVSKASFSLSDIAQVLEEETGLTLQDLAIKSPKEYGYDEEPTIQVKPL